MKKLEKVKILLIYGGQSTEHEVSVLSARNIHQSLDEKKYKVSLIKIDKDGKWFWINQDHLFSDQIEDFDRKKGCGSEVVVDFNNKSFCELGDNIIKHKFDVVFPVLHGLYGEDGTIQGLLRMLDIPFVGSGVLGSAVGMDKDIMKRLLREAGLPVGKFFVLHKNIKTVAFAEVKKKLGLPLFIKPANQGSSIGISKADNEMDYKVGIEKAFLYDTKVIVEEYIEGREIECSVLGNDNPTVSLLGEIVTDKTSHKFYSYEAKYLNENGVSLIAPIKLSKAKIKQIQDMAVNVFKVLNSAGFGRIDFFLCKDGSLYVNEINTIPGFTSLSMYTKLWEVSGVSNIELVDKLIELALDKHKK
ncbi:MAG: D-alanine--D-alanine ligase family protein [Candidatus Paceibacterota bacterium]